MQHDEAFARHGVLNATSARECASTLIADFDIRAVGPEMPVEFLSGGNQQKLVLGRSLYRKPRLLIACQPTRGLDVNAAAEVHRHLIAECARGAGILLISYDLDEILALSDRVLVMYHGRSAGILSREEATRESIGALMLGT
jgi:simple sugar transport system ATP-binding protein